MTWEASKYLMRNLSGRFTEGR